MPVTKEIIIGISILVVRVYGFADFLWYFRGLSPSEPKNLPVHLREGALGVLPCIINVTPLKEVTWLKVRMFWPDRTLVNYNVNAGKRWGSGYEAGLFNITKDYHLEINKVKADDGGDYFCVMTSMTNELVLSDRIVTANVIGITAGDAYSPEDVVYFVIVTMLITIVAIGIIFKRRLERSIRKSKNPGRISYYELWKLATLAVEDREGDKLIDALKVLMNASQIDHHINPNSTDDLYGLLCSWKKTCGKHDRPLDQLFEKCIAAGMGKNIQELKGLRQIVRGSEGPTSGDMKHVLRQIGQHSTDHITQLLKALRIENETLNPRDSGLEDNIEKAVGKVKEWKQGPLSMNPNVLLSFALEDLKLPAGEKDLLTGCMLRLDPNSGARRPASKSPGGGRSEFTRKREQGKSKMV